MRTVRIDDSWRRALGIEFRAPYWARLTDFVKGEYGRQVVYPVPKNIFRAFDLCPFAQVRVVIVGQDPYHGEGQANGLAFAVSEGVATPPSLRNIFKEIRQDLGIEPDPSPDLSRWAEQGVLLLNSVLTVRADEAASHQGQGWEQFTDAVITKLNAEREGIVYLLWGNYAKQKGAHIDRTKNLVLESGHPSPLSARFFHGHHHFSETNKYLEGQGGVAIDWR